MVSVLTLVVVGISVVEDAVVTDVVTGSVISEDVGTVVEVKSFGFCTDNCGGGISVVEDSVVTDVLLQVQFF